MRSLLLSALVGATAFVSQAQTKTVLIEEGTGTWCQYCPRGVYYGHEILSNHSNVLMVAIHQNDVMANTPVLYSSSNFTGLPSGNIDRTNLDVDPGAWEANVVSQLAQTPPADISVSTNWNSSTREVTMTITADFFANLSGDYRLGAIVVEDGITGNTTDYDQSNSYSGGGLGNLGGWENLPNPVPASQIVYDHVARHLATDYDGDPGSLPASISNGSQHSVNLSWTLPQDHDENYTYVIGYITNASTGQILNAGKGTYLNGSSNASPFFVSNPQTLAVAGNAYTYDINTHDPDDENLMITSVLSLPSWLTLTPGGPTQVSMSGVTATLSGTPTTPGTYTIELEVSDGNSTGTQQFDIVVANSTGLDWFYVGSQGFTSDDAGDLELEMSSTDIPYVMYANGNDQVKVIKYENGTWSAIGNPVSGSTYQAAMDMGPNDTPYFITSTSNSLAVYKLDNGSWVQVGSGVGTGVQADITVASDGTPYVAYMDINNSSQGICKKWDGASWATVGSYYSTGQPAVWNKIEMDNNDVPSVLFGTDGSSTFYSRVVQFDGANWNTLGGGAIDPSTTTYFSHELKFNTQNELYVGLIAGSAQHVNVYSFDGANWSAIGSDLVSGSGDAIDISFNLSNEPVVGFRDETNGGKSTVMEYDGSNWTSVGLPGFTAISSGQSLEFDSNGIPYLAYVDEESADKLSVKRYAAPNASLVSLIETDNLVLYPNPNEGTFTVEQEGMTHYQLVNLQGKRIDAGALNEKHTFSYNNLTPGMYILRVTGEKTTQNVSILVR